jgi:hypothetical protein
MKGFRGFHKLQQRLLESSAKYGKSKPEDAQGNGPSLVNTTPGSYVARTCEVDRSGYENGAVRVLF